MDWRFFCIVSQSNYPALWRVRIWTMHCYQCIPTGNLRGHDWNDATDSSDILSVMRKSPLIEYWIFVYIYRRMNNFDNLSVYREMKKHKVRVKKKHRPIIWNQWWNMNTELNYYLIKHCLSWVEKSSRLDRQNRGINWKGFQSHNTVSMLVFTGLVWVPNKWLITSRITK